MIQESEKEITLLLVKYLQKRLNESEKKIVDNWLSKSKANRVHFDKVRQLWIASSRIKDLDAIDIDQQWNKFKQNSGMISPIKKLRRNVNIIKIAASVLLLISLGSYFGGIFNSKIILTGVAGKENRFILPDSSVVWLNRGSSLTYAKDFNTENRMSQLKGEGFFDVTPNTNKPFIIKANKTETKVLGTSFNLKTDLETKETSLVLVEGIVQFTSKKHKEILSAGDKIVVTPDGTLLKSPNTLINFDAWKTGILKFESTPLSEVIEDISSQYRKVIILEDKELAKCNLTGVFDNESFEDVLNILRTILNIKYELTDNNTVIITEGDCPN